jgi:thiamine-phosphate pyrophosphorylase
MPETQLYIVIDSGIDAVTVRALVGATDAQAILIAPPPGAAFEAPVLKSLVEAAQGEGVAALIEDDAQLARTLRADGVHLSWSKDTVARYREAREVLGTRSIVGADAGKSRHDAMTLGEAGADYIGFGIPAHVEDRQTARVRRLELVTWWSEIFEVPCVALDVDTLEEATELARAGADFVALRFAAGSDPAHWARAAKSALQAAESVV